MPRAKEKRQVEPLVRVHQLMETSGVLTTGSVLSRLRAVVGALLSAAVCLGQLVVPFMKNEEGFEPSMDERMRAFFIGTGALTVNLKLHNILFRQGRNRALQDTLEQLDDENFSIYGSEVKEEFRRVNNMVIKFISGYVIYGLIFVLATKALVLTYIGPEPVRLYLSWVPLDDREWFWVNFTLQIVAGFVLLTHGAIASIHFIVTVNQTVAHLRVLSIMLRTPGFSVKAAIQRHILIVRLVRQVNELFCWPLVEELAAYTLQTAYLGFCLIKAFNAHADISVLGEMLYFLGIFGIFVCFSCYCGHIIEIESDRVYESVYDCQWYDFSIPDRKLINIMQCYSTKGLKLAYRNLVTFNMETFSTIMNATRSYLSLLSSLDI